MCQIMLYLVIELHVAFNKINVLKQTKFNQYQIKKTQYKTTLKNQK